MSAAHDDEAIAAGSGARGVRGGTLTVQPLVGAVIAGTQKGGTSALATYFVEHPEIGMPRVKELHYFDADAVFAAPAPDPAPYEAQFARREGVRVYCDATPIYMFWEPVPARVHRYNPAMKWILLLRNPVTRAYSQWNRT